MHVCTYVILAFTNLQINFDCSRRDDCYKFNELKEDISIVDIYYHTHLSSQFFFRLLRRIVSGSGLRRQLQRCE